MSREQDLVRRLAAALAEVPPIIRQPNGTQECLECGASSEEMAPGLQHETDCPWTSLLAEADAFVSGSESTTGSPDC